jgi:hypothetical protein
MYLTVEGIRKGPLRGGGYVVSFARKWDRGDEFLDSQVSVSITVVDRPAFGVGDLVEVYVDNDGIRLAKRGDVDDSLGEHRAGL